MLTITLETVHELNILSKTGVDLWGSCFGGPSLQLTVLQFFSKSDILFIIILVTASCGWLETRSYVRRPGNEWWPVVFWMMVSRTSALNKQVVPAARKLWFVFLSCKLAYGLYTVYLQTNFKNSTIKIYMFYNKICQI